MLELALYGGAVFTLVYGSRETTKNVDAIIKPAAGSPGFLVAKIQGEQAGWEDETKQGRDGGGALWEAAGP